ncbi:nucleotide exchange factor GrpE [Mycoplasmopsis gallinacea]|uniref:Protein GrpE n=1 Tax=Mycoplasmopsis gallinacea TaxID=29556 RepID=A0A6H0V297_9BACT|nr:nucleotide exchange factor GrpE [Mycoplasmopsis gallinacea]QIW62322.1 nucleotide exchange factor GrpE [Mycoplasmopsis gallinacea]
MFNRNNKEHLKIGDKLSGYFEMLANGEVISKYSGEKQIELGKDEYLPKFDKLLVNRKIYKNMEVKFTFPKNYEDELVAGKSVLITIIDLKVSHKKHFEMKINEKDEKVAELEKELAKVQSQLVIKEKELMLQAEAFKRKAEEFQSLAKAQLDQEIEKRVAKYEAEKKEAKKYALSSFVEDLMEPFNNFVLAAKSGENSDDITLRNYCIGFDIVKRQFENVFANNDVTVIYPEVGQSFNAHEQEAIDVVENSNLANEEIVKVVRFGVKVGDRVVKPATVIINKNLAN